MSSVGSTSGTTVSGLTTEAGRSTAGRERGGRGRGRGGRGHSRSGRPPRSTGFRGSVSEMDGNVFECHDEQSDRRQFAKTVEALKGHVNQTLKNAEDVACLFGIEPKQPSIEKPVLPEDADEGDRELWREDLKDLNKRRRVLRGNLMAIEAIIWAQCSEAMKAKVKALKGYLTATEENDCKWFLGSIQSVMMQFDAKHKGYIAMLNATAGFVNCRQHPNQTADHYMEAMRAHVDTVEYHGGRIASTQAWLPRRHLMEPPTLRSRERRLRGMGLSAVPISVGPTQADTELWWPSSPISMPVDRMTTQPILRQPTACWLIIRCLPTRTTETEPAATSPQTPEQLQLLPQLHPVAAPAQLLSPMSPEPTALPTTERPATDAMPQDTTHATVLPKAPPRRPHLCRTD